MSGRAVREVLMRIIGLFSLVPVCALVTLSFFVLFTVTKTEAEGLKKFGRAVAVLLWISAAIVLAGGIRIMFCGGCRCMYAGQKDRMHSYRGRSDAVAGNASAASGDFDVVTGTCCAVNQNPAKGFFVCKKIKK